MQKLGCSTEHGYELPKSLNLRLEYHRCLRKLISCELVFNSQLAVQLGNVRYFFTGRMPFLPPNQESQSSLSLRFNGHFSGEPVLAGFVEAKGDGRGGDNWSYKCKQTPISLTQSFNINLKETEPFPSWVMGVVMTTGAITCKNNSRQLNHLFAGWMPFVPQPTVSKH